MYEIHLENVVNLIAWCVANVSFFKSKQQSQRCLLLILTACKFKWKQFQIKAVSFSIRPYFSLLDTFTNHDLFFIEAFSFTISTKWFCFVLLLTTENQRCQCLCVFDFILVSKSGQLIMIQNRAKSFTKPRIVKLLEPQASTSEWVLLKGFRITSHESTVVFIKTQHRSRNEKQFTWLENNEFLINFNRTHRIQTVDKCHNSKWKQRRMIRGINCWKHGSNSRHRPSEVFDTFCVLYSFQFSKMCVCAWLSRFTKSVVNSSTLFIFTLCD